MPPKGKDKAALRGAQAPQNLDAYLRMNYLYQAGLQQHEQGNQNVARLYAGLLRLIAEKSVLRLTPEAKEFSCKFCNTWLSPMDTLSTRTVRKGKTVVTLKCRICSSVIKRVPIKLARKARPTDTKTTEWHFNPQETLPPPT